MTTGARAARYARPPIQPRCSLLRYAPAALLALLTLSFAREAAAQLRPLPPLPYSTLRESQLRCGAGSYSDQLASLAGVRGTLVQLGECDAQLARAGAILRVAGVAVRRHQETERVHAADFAVEDDGPRREDVGDVVLEVVVPVAGLPAASLIGFRVGMRLPTTDNTVGLERDETDVFAALVAGQRLGRLHIATEVGVGIHGTRSTEQEQQDVFLYVLQAAVDVGRGIELRAAALGQEFWANDWAFRGNEDLGEARLGLRASIAGGPLFVDVAGVAGYRDASPARGVSASLGAYF